MADMGWSQYIAGQEATAEFKAWMEEVAVFLRYPWDLSPEQFDDVDWDTFFKTGVSPKHAVEAILKDLVHRQVEGSDHRYIIKED